MSDDSDELSDHDAHPTENLLSQAIPETDVSTKSGKKQTRQWAAWTRQEEENFFNALRHVGKNFDKITCQVQSKNKDQVRHYYYRLVRRMNKLLGPDLCLDAKNSKDTIAAMLRWWSLLEKYSCKSSKLHLKPRRFKIFIEALESQLLKDRRKMKKKLTFEGESTPSSNMVQHINKDPGGDAPSMKLLIVDGQDIQRVGSGKLLCLKRNGGANNGGNRGDSFSTKGSRQRRRTGLVSSNAYERWEQAAIAGVSLVADAAEQIERTSAHYNGEHNDGTLDKSTRHPLSVRRNFNGTVVQPKTTKSIYSQQLTTEKTVERSKLKLQLFPIDECTRKALEKDEHNPHLELTLSTNKKISSVLEHLIRKWGNCGIATGELILFPYDINLENIESCQNWTLKDNTTKAEEVYASIGSPAIFRLKYGWFSNVKDGSWSSQASLHCTRLSNLMQPHAIHSEVQDTSANDGDDVNVDAMIRNYSPICQKLKHPVDSSLDKASVPLLSFPKDIPPENLMQPSKPDLSPEENDGRISRRGNEGMDDQKKTSTFFLSSGDWADSLTNISVGELLSEVSRRGRDGNYSGNSSGPNPLQDQSSYDSFDAAVAAHISGQVEMPSLLTMISHGSILDGEETCDAFSFQKKSLSKDQCQPVNAFVAGRETKCINSVKIHNLDEEFNHLVPSTNVHKEEDSSRNACLTDLYWPDSLGPLDLDIRPFKYHNHDLLMGDSISLSGLSRLIASSLDTFQNCSFFSSDKKETSGGEGPISDYKIKGEV